MSDKPLIIDGALLAALGALAEKATPGPWLADIRSGIAAVYPPPQHNCLDLPEKAFVAVKYGKQDPEKRNWNMDPQDNANMAYIAAASPPVVRALVAEVERLRGDEAQLVALVARATVEASHD